MLQDMKNLIISGLISVSIGLLVFFIASSESSGLRAQIAALTAQVQALQAGQVSAAQQLADGDAQQKALVLRLDELAGRIDAVEKQLAPPPPPVAATSEAVPAVPAAAEPAVAAPAPAVSAPAAPAPGAPIPLVPAPVPAAKAH
ncbi:MAG: hypothetical protein HY055_18430 [Magnetospirillum sp.]|nr:hypothetical protein [Magnetospirillum sp.]